MLDRRAFVTASAALGAATLAAGTRPAEAAQVPSQDLKLTRTLHDGIITQTYFVAKPIEQVWRAYTTAAERKTWYGIEQSPIQGALEVRPPKLLRFRMDYPSLPGPANLTVRFEAVAGGTRITHMFASIGDSPLWENALQSTADGVDEQMSDFALYLHTGVGFPRHTGRGFGARSPHPNDLREGTRNVPGGIEVLDVPAGSFLAEAGVRPDDIVVALGDGGIFDMRDPRLANAMFARGDVVQLTWIRNGEVMRGKGRMTYTEPRLRK